MKNASGMMYKCKMMSADFVYFLSARRCLTFEGPATGVSDGAGRLRGFGFGFGINIFAGALGLCLGFGLSFGAGAAGMGWPGSRGCPGTVTSCADVLG